MFWHVPVILDDLIFLCNKDLFDVIFCITSTEQEIKTKRPCAGFILQASLPYWHEL